MKAKIRSLFIAPKNKLLLAVDFSQGETWITAHLANEQTMIRYLITSDVHTETANFLFHPEIKCEHAWVKKGKGAFCTICELNVIETERYIGKQNNHANSYGMGAERQAQVINKRSDLPPFVVVSIKQCKGYQEAWHGLYPNIHNWHMEVQRELISKRTLITPYGFRRRFYEHMNDQLFKAAYAFIPQSTLLDHCSGKLQPGNEIPGGLRVVKQTFVDKYPNDFKIINMSHDSFCMECPTDQIKSVGEECVKIMQRPMIVNGVSFTIPVDAEFGENYGEMNSL